MAPPIAPWLPSVDRVLSEIRLMWLSEKAPSDRKVADFIGDIVSSYRNTSRQYMRDCLTIWARHRRSGVDADTPSKPPQQGAGLIGGEFSEEEQLGIARDIRTHAGCVLLLYAERRIAAMQKDIVPAASVDHARNLSRLLRRIVETTQFAKTGYVTHPRPRTPESAHQRCTGTHLCIASWSCTLTQTSEPL